MGLLLFFLSAEAPNGSLISPLEKTDATLCQRTKHDLRTTDSDCGLAHLKPIDCVSFPTIVRNPPFGGNPNMAGHHPREVGIRLQNGEPNGIGYQPSLIWNPSLKRKPYTTGHLLTKVQNSLTNENLNRTEKLFTNYDSVTVHQPITPINILTNQPTLHSMSANDKRKREDGEGNRSGDEGENSYLALYFVGKSSHRFFRNTPNLIITITTSPLQCSTLPNVFLIESSSGEDEEGRGKRRNTLDMEVDGDDVIAEAEEAALLGGKCQAYLIFITCMEGAIILTRSDTLWLSNYLTCRAHMRVTPHTRISITCSYFYLFVHSTLILAFTDAAFSPSDEVGEDGVGTAEGGEQKKGKKKRKKKTGKLPWENLDPERQARIIACTKARRARKKERDLLKRPLALALTNVPGTETTLPETPAATQVPQGNPGAAGAEGNPPTIKGPTKGNLGAGTKTGSPKPPKDKGPRKGLKNQEGAKVIRHPKEAKPMHTTIMISREGGEAPGATDVVELRRLLLRAVIAEQSTSAASAGQLPRVESLVLRGRVVEAVVREGGQALLDNTLAGSPYRSDSTGSEVRMVLYVGEAEWGFPPGEFIGALQGPFSLNPGLRAGALREVSRVMAPGATRGTLFIAVHRDALPFLRRCNFFLFSAVGRVRLEPHRGH